MKKLIGGMALLAVMGVWAAPAVAQIATMPVYTSPAGYAGVKISADWGMGLNDDSKFVDSSPMAFGGMLGFGTGMFNINAGAAYVDTKDEAQKKPISFGGNIGVTVLPSTEQSPLAVNVFAGGGYTKYEQEASGDQFKKLDIPFGVGIGFSPPTSGNVGFEIWAAPRGVYSRWDFGGDDTSSRFGFGASGGVNVNFNAGFGIHAAIDWATFSEKTEDLLAKYSPLHFGAGLHYTFRTPS